MPPILDFSSALPWLVAGFLAGLLAYWLLRALLGGDQRHATELANLSARLDAASQQFAAVRQSAEDHANNANYYQDQFKSLLDEHQGLSRQAASHAGLVTKLQADYANASREAGEAARLKSELASAKAEYVALRNEFNVRLSSEQSHTDEINRLKADLAAASNASGDVSRLTRELEELKSGAGASISGYTDEIAALKAEVAKSAAALDAAQASERTTAMELHTAKTDLAQVRTALEETSRIVAERHTEIEQLRTKLAAAPADIDNYKRFKDALDAANRIAAGLPEKA